MDRRTFIEAMAGGLLAAPLAAGAQEARVARIGLVSTGSPRGTPAILGFEQRLRELGHIEGQNILIEFRNAEGHVDRLPGLVAELVRLRVDVIVTATVAATRAAKDATSKIPIVIAAIDFDPIALGYVSSLAWPGANVTGVFFRQSELAVKRLQLFKELLPSLDRLAVLSDSLSADQLNAVEAASPSIGVKLLPVNLGKPPLRLRERLRGCEAVPRQRALRADIGGHLPRPGATGAPGAETQAPDELRSSRAR